MERVRQKSIKLEESTQRGRGDAANILRDKDEKYGTTELKVPAVVQPQTADDAASSAPTTFGELMETLDHIRRRLQMPQVNSRPGCSYMRLGSGKPQTHEHVLSLPPAPMPDWSPIPKSKHVNPVSFNPWISSPKLITIYESESDEDMVMAPASTEECLGKLASATLYQFQIHSVCLFWDVTALTWFQWPHCETWWSVYTCARVR